MTSALYNGSFFQQHAAAVAAGLFSGVPLLLLLETIRLGNFAGLGWPVYSIYMAVVVLVFGSFIAFLVFLPASYVLYRLLRAYGLRNALFHCLAGILCVPLTIVIVALIGIGLSFSDPHESENEAAIAGQPIALDALGVNLLAVLTISGALGGYAFYLSGPERSRRRKQGDIVA